MHKAAKFMCRQMKWCKREPIFNTCVHYYTPLLTWLHIHSLGTLTQQAKIETLTLKW